MNRFEIVKGFVKTHKVKVGIGLTALCLVGGVSTVVIGQSTNKVAKTTKMKTSIIKI